MLESYLSRDYLGELLVEQEPLLDFSNDDTLRTDGTIDHPLKAKETNPNVTGEYFKEAIDLFRSQLRHYPVFGAEQEQHLAHDMETTVNALLSLSCQNKAGVELLLSLVKMANGNTITVESAGSRQNYHHLKRELDVLTKKLKNASSHFSPKELTQLSWPAPLVIATITILKDPRCHATDPLICAIVNQRKNDKYAPLDELDSESTSYARKHLKHYYLLREKFINHNLRLVYRIAKQHAEKPDQILELIQEGTIGLMRAVDKYQLSSGYRFSTYAYHWIESKVRAAKSGLTSIINVPRNIQAEQGKLMEAAKYYRAQDQQLTLLKVADSIGISQEKLKVLTHARNTPLSLDQTLAGTEDTNLHNLIEDEQFTPGKFAHKLNIQFKIREVMDKTLNEREKSILCYRYGLNDGIARTHVEVGKAMSLSRERVRQIESEATDKIKHFIGEHHIFKPGDTLAD